MSKAFPKIFAIGHREIKSIFDDPVEITEKVDGSQFGFGKTLSGELFCRSKGKELVLDAPEKMFNKVVEYVRSIQYLIPNGFTFYAEYLQKPRHNVLAYDRTPKNGLALFGVIGGDHFAAYNTLIDWGAYLEIDVAPILYKGKVETPESLLEIMDDVSFLGGQKMEGVVVKNHAKSFMLGGQYIPIMAGKYVSERFKEIHQKHYKTEGTGKSRWELHKEGYRTEARWEKAIIHLRERGELTDSPKDIGTLIKEIQNDITEEEQESIKDFLWKEFGKEVLRKAVVGLPEWYKEKLMSNAFTGGNV